MNVNVMSYQKCVVEIDSVPAEFSWRNGNTMDFVVCDSDVSGDHSSMWRWFHG